jgi:hypothetical protein
VHAVMKLTIITDIIASSRPRIIAGGVANEIKYGLKTELDTETTNTITVPK